MIRRMLIPVLAACAALSTVDADDGGTVASPTESIDETPIDTFDRGHWAYLPIEKPPLPIVELSSWPRTTIDHFILSRIEAESLSPAGEADRATLIRRLCFDLTGLPPTTEQVASFLADTRPDAYERVVDSLLASPQFGRRWAQYWLDLARFAETDGFEHDKVRPTAWRYRDWVIDAINNDMPYDQFVRWQVAGDVLAPESESEQGAIATAFCLSGPDMPDINSQQERKHVLMNEVTSTVGAVFLSLQFGCAQCHDHKFDAISQADFYRLRAFFDPAVALKQNQSVTTLEPSADPDAESHLMIRGDWRRTGPLLEAAFPRIVNSARQDVAQQEPARRRAELAHWLTSPENPLTARSIVNRVWQHHFGRGLSTTPSDFGVMGGEPSHPGLLDYLADELMSRGWSLKQLHRAIVLSSVYRTRSAPPVETADQAEGSGRWAEWERTDPANRWLARFPRRRLDAESLRDAMLCVSGLLNHETGGPGVRPPLPPEMVKTLKSGQWEVTEDRSDHYRRSIYVFARRNLRYPFFATFDRPAANASCAVRQQSTTAVQSLLLFNSDTTLAVAKRLADDLIFSQPNRPAQQCRELYRRLYSREPSASELADCVGFLTQQRQLLDSEDRNEASREALIDLCRGLLNTNEFIYVD